MANDVSIIVSADLGDTLIKLDLAKHAINDLGDASVETAAKQDAAAASTGFFSGILSQLGPDATSAVPLLGGLTTGVTVLGVAAGVAAIAVVFLADVIGSLVAVVADLVAPLLLVTGLLGGLGLAFGLAAVKAFGMHEDGLGQAVKGLKKQFDELTSTLVGRFMPVFRFLISSASDALGYLNRIAKLPLGDAFRSLATTGVQAVSHFLQQVGHMLARPFRLAVQIAFGSGKGGNEIASAVSGLWKQFTDFLFGYQVRHPVELRPGVFKIKTSTVDGALQPFLDWFNRHDFTKQGEKIGHSLLNGLTSSGAAKRMGDFIVAALGDAFKTVFRAAVREFNRLNTNFETSLQRWHNEITNWVETPFVSAWNKIKQVGGDALTLINNHLGNVKSAISTVKGLANDFWGILQKIAGFFAQVFTLNVHWPSPPSWLSSIVGGVGGAVGGAASTLGGLVPGIQGANVSNLAGGTHFHFHAGPGMSGIAERAAFSRFSRQVGQELARQQGLLAGGH